MILNQDYDFMRDAPQGVKDAFKSPPRKVLLRVGQKLYRILTPAGVAEIRSKAWVDSLKPDPNEVGQWWMTQKTFKHLVEVSKRQGTGLSDVVRAQLAISQDFSKTMNALCIIRMKRDMYAFEGIAAPQPLAKESPNVLLMGNADQVWIPQMAWNDVFLERFLNSFEPIILSDLSPNLTVTLAELLQAQRKK